MIYKYFLNIKILIFIVILLYTMNYYNKYLKYKKKYIKLKRGGSNVNASINVNNNLLIYKNFFDNNTFRSIKKYCSKLQFKNDPRRDSRKTLCLSPVKHKILYDLIYKNNKFKKIIQNIDSKPFLEIPSFPIEYRIYPTGSSGMELHRDSSLFSPDALEIVLTLENTSDSKFGWVEDDTENLIKTDANTLAIVKPGTVLHKVTAVRKGFRTILKFIVEFKNSSKKKFI